MVTQERALDGYWTYLIDGLFIYSTTLFSYTAYMISSGKIIVNDEMKSMKMWPVTNLRLYPEFSLEELYEHYKGSHWLICRGIIYIEYKNILAMHFVMIMYVDGK